ncbi:transposase [Paenibacillus pasadenensis]|uniref:helix-turn-helix domain-containing protein n=1 Tax=Paenibacillus pasadenensis TaxID=217090 RepID=UPI00048B8ED1|nr:helix-turn-helix domain-containing protein [Paenibacillus pasadenensis]
MKQHRSTSGEVRTQVVRESLDGVPTAELARKYAVSQRSIRAWVREYQEKAALANKSTASTGARLDSARRLAEMEEKYEQVQKLLAEKELESEILRALINTKTNSPASMNDLKFRNHSSGRGNR